MDNSLIELIVESAGNSHLVKVLKLYMDAFYETCLNYDKKIDKKTFFDFLEFTKRNILPKIFSTSACHLHAYMNYYGKTEWKKILYDKRDLRKLTPNFDELIPEYVGCCFNMSWKYCSTPDKR